MQAYTTLPLSKAGAARSIFQSQCNLEGFLIAYLNPQTAMRSAIAFELAREAGRLVLIRFECDRAKPVRNFVTNKVEPYVLIGIKDVRSGQLAIVNGISDLNVDQLNWIEFWSIKDGKDTKIADL